VSGHVMSRRMGMVSRHDVSSEMQERGRDVRYLSLQDAGSIGAGGAVVGTLQSTKTIRRPAFGAAGFTAPMMGVQVGGNWKRSLRASLDREMSSANSWIDASSVRTRARVPTMAALAPRIDWEGHPRRLDRPISIRAA